MLEHLSEKQPEAVASGEPLSLAGFGLASMPVAAGVVLGTWFLEFRTMYAIASITLAVIGMIGLGWWLWRLLLWAVLRIDSDPTNKIVFHCTNGHRIVVRARFAGQRGKCSKCGTPVIIPDADPLSESAAIDSSGGTPMAVKTTLVFDDNDDDPQRLRDRVVKWVNEPTPFASIDELKYAAGGAQEFRPILRPPTPILTLLDDGSMEHGEDVRIRQETLRIGRTSGDVRIPHDVGISGAHAEIRRSFWQGGYQWHLHDLDSVNGTFAKTDEAVLHKDIIVILGSRRYRLEHKLKPNIVEDSTLMYSDPPIPEKMCPVLAEASVKPEALEFELRSDRLVIGQMYSGADIEIDDPLLDDRHAELKLMQDGSWAITCEGTTNGIWVSTSATLLSPLGYFRCGEQRFRFMIP